VGVSAGALAEVSAVALARLEAGALAGGTALGVGRPIPMLARGQATRDAGFEQGHQEGGELCQVLMEQDQLGWVR